MYKILCTERPSELRLATSALRRGVHIAITVEAAVLLGFWRYVRGLRLAGLWGRGSSLPRTRGVTAMASGWSNRNGSSPSLSRRIPGSPVRSVRSGCPRRAGRVHRSGVTTALAVLEAEAGPQVFEVRLDNEKELSQDSDLFGRRNVPRLISRVG